MRGVYISQDEALEAIRRIEGVVKLSSSTIGAALGRVCDPDAKKVIYCEQCANYHQRIIDGDIIIQFEHCQKGIRFDNPRTFYCAYATPKG